MTARVAGRQTQATGSVDFTSALYLGFNHSAAEVGPWAALTTGRPAALGEPDVAGRVTRRLARLIGLGDATLAPSTLHAAFDLFAALGRQHGRWVVAVDEHAYPILPWAANRLRPDGVPVVRLPHHRPESVARAVSGGPGGRRRPIVVVDGTCAGCGVATMADYARVTAAHDGVLVVDDTQSLGVLGRAPDEVQPLGRGGGGSVPWHTLRCDVPLVIVASLAKAFGVPISVTAAAPDVISELVRHSEVRTHCSPPSVVHLMATERALRRNRTDGDAARACLVRNVRLLRAGLDPLHVLASPDVLPVQRLGPFDSAVGSRLHVALARRGVRTVLQPAHQPERVHVTFLVTARHRRRQLDHAICAVREALAAAK